MTGTRRTAILETSAIAVPLLARQIFVGGIIHRGVGRNEILTRCHWERGLTTAFEATSNKIDPTEDEEEHSGGGASATQKRRTRMTKTTRTTNTTRKIAQLMTSGTNSSATMYFLTVPYPSTITHRGYNYGCPTR